MDRKKKNKKTNEHDPEKYINTKPTDGNSLTEAESSTAVITFGRMNPVTAGHEKLVNKVIAEALRRKAAPMVFLSHSQDKKKNPLSYDTKIKHATKAFGNVVKKSKARSIIEVAKELSGRFDDLIVVVGQDRIKEFDTLLNKYNGKEFNFDSIKVVSAGQRDPDAEGVEGMSASKMREFAKENDLDSFKKGLPKRLQKDAAAVLRQVRAGMNLTEEYIEERAPLSVSQRRRRGMIMKRYRSKLSAARKRAQKRRASPEKLKQRAQKKALSIIRDRVSKNKKYSEMSTPEKIALDKRVSRVPRSVINRIARKELPKVKRAEALRFSKINEDFDQFILEAEDPDVGHMKGSQPKDYYKGVKKSVKDDRARHFKKYGKMDDDNPAAYKPAPGDKGAQTKPSKHTKKFKQMFGEVHSPRKRPHMGLNKNGSVKIDKRFKIFKKKINESEENLLDQILDLQESVESLFESNTKKVLKDKSEKTGIPYSILKDVFDRGVAAWRTGHRPGTTPTQWGIARVNSFSTKGKGTWGKADKDLAAKARKAMKKESVNEAKETQFTHGSYKTLNFDICPSAKAAFDKSKETAQDERKLLDAAKAVDRYLGIEKDLRLKDEVTKDDFDRMTDAVDAAKEEIREAGLKGHDYHGVHIKAVKDMMEKVNENAATERAKARIKAEKQRDARKHDRMLDRAKMRDLRTKLTREGTEKTSEREWGTTSLTKTYKKDTPGEDLKEQSPYEKDLPRGSRVRFQVKKITGEDYTDEGTVVGTDPDTLRLRVRDDSGQLHIVKHEDASKIG